jgi:signal transduction histidine kinase/DNA-binding response OmpR family regulator
MLQPRQPTADAERHQRFMAGVQKSRLAVYAIAGVLNIAGKLTGVADAPLVPGLSLLAAGILSSLLFEELYRRGLERRLGFELSPTWLGLDTVLITWAVAITGGLASPWFLWYLSNVSAAAFVGSRRLAVAVGLANTVSYFAVLVFVGQVRLDDATIWIPASRMAFLYGAAIFFLRATVSLQEKQRLVKRLQQEQEQKVDQLVALTQDLDQGTRALAEANIQIRDADRMKSQFLANMSHELRTPLNAIIGFSEILLDRLVGEIPTKYVKFLHNIHTSGQHLLGIINDILDLSKVEAGKMDVHPESFRLASAIEGVLNVMHGLASKRRITFEVEAPDSLPPVATDPAKFKQILYNLLTNAVKFSQERSTVLVSARHLEAAESPLGVEAFAVSVTDSGIGIAAADQEVIFHEFQQADGSATRQFGGTGLGLALVKKFVELQGGIVTLDSDVGRGSTFTVTLPLKAHSIARPVAPLPGPLEALLPGDNRILVVEDDLVAYQSLSRSLSEAGYLPIRARHGEEALALARMLRPTAITLDLALPGISGWDVLKQLKGEPATKTIPVVIISMMDNRELGLTLGADDYFVKPVDRQQLVARLSEIAPPREPSRKPRLLVVDDDPAIHEFLESELSPLGYALDHALGGAEGLDHAIRTKPDAIVLDLMMPDLTGFEVAAALKERHDTAHVPIIVLTAKDVSDEERARLHGKIAALVPKGRAASTRLVETIRDLESRQPRELARVR